MDEVKPFGPVQLYVAPLIVEAVRFKVAPAHIGLLLSAVGVAGGVQPPVVHVIIIWPGAPVPAVLYVALPPPPPPGEDPCCPSEPKGPPPAPPFPVPAPPNPPVVPEPLAPLSPLLLV